MKKDINLRTTFNSEAKLYRVIRPRYPEKLFVALVKNAQLQRGAKLLEIGPGTGQATEPLAKRGYNITAIELGTDLVEVTQKVLARYANVKIITGTFEDVELHSESFDLVYAATAFHWIKPEVKFSKPHKLLKESGHLAIINTNHISDERGDKFFFASQLIYKNYKHGGKDDSIFRLKHADDLKADEVDENLFAPVFFHAFPIAVSYSAKKYAQLLNTYASIISMESAQRAMFLEEIEKLIEEKFSGSIQKHLAMTLTIAKKKS